MRSGVKSTGAVALVTSGIASAFALAACCAIPIFLAAAGLGAGWLMPIVAVTQPYAEIITAFSAVALVASVFIVLWAAKRCEPGALCARLIFRWSIIVAAAIGMILLVLSKIYA